MTPRLVTAWLDDEEEAARCGVADPAALWAGHELAARGVGEDFDHEWLLGALLSAFSSVPRCAGNIRNRLLSLMVEGQIGLHRSPGGARSQNEHQPHAKDLFLLSSQTSQRAQSPNELSQLVSFLCPRAVTIISIPLARGRAAASTMHPANPPTPYCGARQRCPLRFDLAVQRGALWALSIGSLRPLRQILDQMVGIELARETDPRCASD
jgi:hypothetical protein